MLAARMYGKNDIRLEELDLVLGTYEILLKVKAAAICGTDIRMYKNGQANINEENPRILGHEIAGIIAAKGKGVEAYSVGDRVSVAPNAGCGLCSYCIRGDGHLCQSYEALGIQLDGGFAEYVVIPEKFVRQGNITPIPDNVTFEEAAINEPFSCVYNGFLRCDIRPGDKVLIVGAGPIGIMHAMLALNAGASKVYMNDILEERVNQTVEVDKRIISIYGNAEEQISEVDVCITACPSAEAQAMALRITSINGRVNFFGGVPASKQPVALDTNLIHYKQLIVSGTTRSSLSQYRKTLQFIEHGNVDLKKLITERYPLERIHDALDNASGGIGLKHIIVF